MKIKNIILANDHAAVDVKFNLIKYLESKGYNIINVGTNNLQSVHYPYYALKAADLLISQPTNSRAIVLCGTGVGISIAANKIKGIRCMVCHNALLAKVAREEFDINMLGLGARVTGSGLIESIVDVFLNTSFNEKNSAKKSLLDNMLVKKDFTDLQTI